MFTRVLELLIHDPEMAQKMIFLAGPRQVGKTTLAQKWLASSPLYFNWDNEKIRRDFRKDPHFFESAARQTVLPAKIVFDEIHKIPRWKTVLKGYYDTFKSDFNFFVTGSARLDLLQRSGDSMLGRYHLLHLSPLMPHELEKNKIGFQERHTQSSNWERKPLSQESIEALIAFSGFPDMTQKQSQRSLNLWHREYRQRIIREDLRDLTRISDLSRSEFLFDLLPTKVGAPLSFNSLREDLLCSHDAIKTMIEAFQKLSVVFLIRPYSKKIKNALSKEPKLYFCDWTRVQDEGARFENFIAVQLKTYCDFITDGGFSHLELFYVRDKQKHEVDFLLVQDGKPTLLVEAKCGDNDHVRTLEPISRQLGSVLSVCVTKKSGTYKKIGENMWSISANRFFNLFWN